MKYEYEKYENKTAIASERYAKLDDAVAVAALCEPIPDSGDLVAKLKELPRTIMRYDHKTQTAYWIGSNGRIVGRWSVAKVSSWDAMDIDWALFLPADSCGTISEHSHKTVTYCEFQRIVGNLNERRKAEAARGATRV